MQPLPDALHSIEKITMAAMRAGVDFLLMNLAYTIEVAKSVAVEEWPNLFLLVITCLVPWQ